MEKERIKGGSLPHSSASAYNYPQLVAALQHQPRSLQDTVVLLAAAIHIILGASRSLLESPPFPMFCCNHHIYVLSRVRILPPGLYPSSHIGGD